MTFLWCRTTSKREKKKITFSSSLTFFSFHYYALAFDKRTEVICIFYANLEEKVSISFTNFKNFIYILYIYIYISYLINI